MKDVKKWFFWFIVAGPIHITEQFLMGLDELYELRGQVGMFYSLFGPGNEDYATVTLVILGLVAVQLMLYAVLVGGRVALIPLGFFGLMGLVESHHIIKTIVRGEYFPGAVTAIIYITVGLLLCRAVLAELRKAPSRQLVQA